MFVGPMSYLFDDLNLGASKDTATYRFCKPKDATPTWDKRLASTGAGFWGAGELDRDPTIKPEWGFKRLNPKRYGDVASIFEYANWISSLVTTLTFPL